MRIRVGYKGLLLVASKLLLACLFVVYPLSAQVTGTLDAVYEGIGVDQKLGDRIPLDLMFTDENGKQVALGDYFEGERPVILTLVYHNCPMLCNVLMDGFTGALQELEWAPGSNYDIVTISINPVETHTLASEKKAHYVSQLGKDDAADGWHFLTGSEESITAVADAIGFRYRWLDDIEQFVHPAIITVLTPDGTVSRYIQGLQFEPRDIRLALVEASNGSIAQAIDLIALYCLQYDPESNSYVAHASNLMRLGGFLTVIVLGTVLFAFWRRESKGYSPSDNIVKT